MFFKKNNTLPVNEFDKNLIEKSLLWFEYKLGGSYIKSQKQIVPSQCDFRYTKFDSDDEIRYFIEYICEHIKLDSSIIEHTIVTNDTVFSNEAVMTQEYDDNKQILFEKNEDGKYDIMIYSKSLMDFDIAFLKLAYVLTYIKFLNEKIFSFANGYMINTGMALLGFGIWGANSVIKSHQWKGLTHHGWQVQRFGFITQRMYGYLLGLLFQYSSANQDELHKYLCADVLKPFKQSLSVIKEDGNILFLTNHEPIKVNDEEVFMRKYFYTNGKIKTIAHFKDRKYEGRMLFYHENGIFWGERIYLNGISHNVISNYDKHGDAVEKGSLKDGNGTLYIYNPDGTLFRIEEYRDSQKVSL